MWRPFKNVRVRNFSAASQTLSPVKDTPLLAHLRVVSSQRCYDRRSTQALSYLVKYADDAVLLSQTRPPGICGLAWQLLSGAESQREDVKLCQPLEAAGSTSHHHNPWRTCWSCWGAQWKNIRASSSFMENIFFRTCWTDSHALKSLKYLAKLLQKNL